MDTTTGEHWNTKKAGDVTGNDFTDIVKQQWVLGDGITEMVSRHLEGNDGSSPMHKSTSV